MPLCFQPNASQPYHLLTSFALKAALSLVLHLPALIRVNSSPPALSHSPPLPPRQSTNFNTTINILKTSTPKMAFLTASHLTSNSSKVNSLSSSSSKTKCSPSSASHAVVNTPRATATQPTRPMTRRNRTSAPVIDSRVASRHEAHHWVVVLDHSRRLFERAAVAQADLARQLEARQSPGAGALHRWVLREIDSHPLEKHDGFVNSFHEKSGKSRYLVTESFDRLIWNDTMSPHYHSLTRRWLSAVEQVGPLINTVDIHSLQYSDVFTSKLHDVVFDPRSNVVVLHSINVQQGDLHAMDAVVAALRAKAERSVAVGACLEFGVLQSETEPSLFKTVEIFSDMDALVTFADGADKLFEKSIQPHIVGGCQHRHVFKPVVFS